MTACCITKGVCNPGAPCGRAWPLSRNSLFCEASKENSQNARARMLRAERIRIPGSKEANFFPRFYQIPCVGFPPFGGKHGLVYYYRLLEHCGATAPTAVPAFAYMGYIEISLLFLYVVSVMMPTFKKYCSDIFLL